MEESHTERRRNHVKTEEIMEPEAMRQGRLLHRKPEDKRNRLSPGASAKTVA